MAIIGLLLPRWFRVERTNSVGIALLRWSNSCNMKYMPLRVLVSASDKHWWVTFASLVIESVIHKHQ
jgi:hypothetical protein